MLIDWVQFTPPAPFSARHAALLRGRRGSPPRGAVQRDRVQRPRTARATSPSAAPRLDDLFSVGPILEGIGLNVTAWSYVDRMNFSLLSCPDLVADLASLAARLRPALDELLDDGGRRRMISA